MAMELVIHAAWADYVRGQVIREPAQVTEILASENAGKVHRIQVADPAPEPPALTVAEAVAKGVADAEAALHPSV